jgi:mannose-6-phosphate isomerase-like protein (cupin superfamily)
MHGKSVTSKVPMVVEKRWGSEKWLVNNEEEDYCSKLLNIKGGSEFSLHFHSLKHESFMLMSGWALLVWVDTKSGKENIVTMESERVYEIPRNVPHRVRAIQDSVILEISTFHRDTDSHRVNA